MSFGIITNFSYCFVNKQLKGHKATECVKNKIIEATQYKNNATIISHLDNNGA